MPNTLELNPAQAQLKVGDRVNLEIIMDGPELVNAAQVVLNYPKAVLALTGIDFAGSAFPIEAITTSIPGRLQLDRGVTQPVSGLQTLAILTFTAVGPGQGLVEFIRNGMCILYRAADTVDVLGATADALITVAPVSSALDISLNNAQKVKVFLNPRTPSGLPAPLDGPPRWGVLAGASTLLVDSDGLAAELISSDALGDTTYLIEADADLGAGVETISGLVRLTVTGQNSPAMGLNFSDPVPK